MCPYGAVLRQLCTCFMILFVGGEKKRSCSELSLDGTAESLGFSLCLGEATLCARKGSVLSLGRSEMVFLKGGIDMATELTQILLKMPGT